MKLIILLLLLCSVTGVCAQDFSKKDFEDIVAKIQETSLHKLTESEIYEGAIKGILAKIEEKNLSKNDAHANVILSPQKNESLQTTLEGEITGIGVVIKFDRDKGQKYPNIVEVLDGGGKDADLKAGDEILKVDETAVSQIKDLMDLVYRIRGPVGSKLKLSLLRDGEIFTKKIVRKKIPFKSVDVFYPQKDIGQLKIKYFNKKTSNEVKEALSEMQNKKVSLCILDLRENDGGLFDEGVEALKLFADKDVELLKIKRHSEKFEIVKSDSKGVEFNCKWVVLVNEQTKSMGEAFTSSFRLLKSATVIGQPTFGKASMETVLKLDNGYSVKYTIGQLYNSKGETWAGKGIAPDIFVPSASMDGDSKKDDVLELAVNFLRK